MVFSYQQKMKKICIALIALILFVPAGLHNNVVANINNDPVPSLADKLKEILGGVTPFNQFVYVFYLRQKFLDLVAEDQFRVLGTRSNLLFVLNSQITETQLRRIIQLITTTIVIPGAIVFDPQNEELIQLPPNNHDNNNSKCNHYPNCYRNK